MHNNGLRIVLELFQPDIRPTVAIVLNMAILVTNVFMSWSNDIAHPVLSTPMIIIGNRYILSLTLRLVSMPLNILV